MGVLKKIVKDYFTFSRGQRNALFVLVFIILTLIVIPPFFRPAFLTKSNVDSLAQDYNQFVNHLSANIPIKLDSLFYFDPNLASEADWIQLGFSIKQTQSIMKFIGKSGGIKNTEELKKIYSISEAQFQKIEPYVRLSCTYNKVDKFGSLSHFPFDPNKASENDLKQLGFPEKLITTLQNYRLHGGKFKNPDDLKRLYGMPEQLYNDLLTYIKIEKDSTNLLINHSGIEFNQADSADLESLKGIGPELASRIIKYRTFLGGFYSKDQLFEIPGITAQNFSLFENLVIIDTMLIQKINLNTLDMKKLNKHPYLRYDDCKAIITYLRIMKKFKTIDELRKNKLISDESYKKIKPYLVAE